MIGILEDDIGGRQPAFRQALAPSVPVIYDNAPGFLRWLEGAFDTIRLLSLDHDLGPSRNGVDPGEGMAVVDFLVARKPAFPVIVHSSNPYSAPTMVRRLDEAGWAAERIVPWGDDWIPTVWIARVQVLVK